MRKLAEIAIHIECTPSKLGSPLAPCTTLKYNFHVSAQIRILSPSEGEMQQCNELIHFIHLRFEKEEEGSELRKSMPRSKGTKNRKTREEAGGRPAEGIGERGGKIFMKKSNIID